MTDADFGPVEAPAAAAEAPGVEPDFGPVEPQDNPAALQRVLGAVPDAGEPVDLTAYKAVRAGLAPDKAGQAIRVAQRTGVSPQFAADNLDEAQAQLAQQDTSAKLARAPGVAAYAGQSAVHAAAVKDDLDHLSFIEWAITGKWDRSVTGQGPTFYTPPFWWAALKDALAEQKYVAITGKKGTVGLTPDEEQQLGQLRRQGQEQVSYGAQAVPAKMIAGAVRALPSLTVIGSGVAVGALGGPAGEYAGGVLANFTQTYGPLYDRLSQLAGPDGARLLSDTEARAIAGVGAMSTSAVSTYVGGPLLQKLPGVREVLQRISGQAVTEALTRPGVAQLLTDAGVKFGKNYAAGIAMMWAQAAGEQAVEEAAKATHGVPADPVRIAYAGADAAENAAKTLPLIAAYSPVVEAIGAAGRGYAEQLRLRGMVDAAKRSPLVGREPGVAAEVMRQATDAPGADGTAYVSKEAWDAHHGEQAQARAAELAQDNGRSYAEAEATGGPVAVPLEEHLTAGLADAEKLLPDTKLSPDSSTPNEAKEAADQFTGEGHPIAPEPPAPSRTEAQSFRDQASTLLEAKPIGDISSGYYDQAAARAGRKIVELATTHNKVEDKLLDQYAKILGTSLDNVREAVAAARQGFLGAGMQSISEGALGTGTLRAAGRRIGRVETAAGKVEGGGVSKLEELELQHAQSEVERNRALADLQRKQQFSTEAARLARSLTSEMDRLQARLVNVDRNSLAAADPAYLTAYDALAQAVSGVGQAAPGAIDGAIAGMEADARPLGFDDAAVRELLTNPREWSKLTPPEARNLADAVASLQTAARQANEIALADRRATLREFVAGVADYARQHGPPGQGGLPPPSNAGKGAFERAGEKLSAAATEMLQPEVILRRLGPGGDQVMGEFTSSRNTHSDLQGEVGEAIYKAVRKAPAELRRTALDAVDGPGSPVVADDKWTRQDLRMLASWFGSESGAQRLRDGLRITDEQIRRALEQLTPKEATFIDSLHALNDEKLWPLVRDHEIAATGTAPPKIEARPYTVRLADGTIHTFRGGYWPGVDANPKPRAVDGTISGFWGTLRDGMPSTSKSFVNERSDRTAYRPNLNWEAYTGHVAAVLRYLAYDEFVRNFGRVLQDPEFRQVVADQQGPQAPQELDKFLSVTARGYVEPAKDGANQLGSIIGGGFRSRVATGAFQLNVPVVVGQLSHIPATMFGMRIAPWHILEGLGKTFTSSWAPPASEQLPYRWNGYGAKMREQLSAISPETTGAPRRFIDAAGWSLYHVMDGFLSKTIYESALAKSGSTAEADKAVSAMMPKLNLAEQSSVARDRGIIGSLLLVRNFPNTLYNVGALNAWQARLGIWDSSPGLARAGAIAGQSALAAGTFLGMVWSAHIFGRFLMGHGRQEDESTAEWLTRDALSAPFYPIPFGTDVAEPLSAAAAAAAFRDKPIAQTLLQHQSSVQSAPALALLEHAIHDFALATSDNRMDSDRMYFAAKLAAAALKLPVYPLKPAKYAYDLFHGDVQPRGQFDVAGGFLYGQRPRQERNPLTVAQDKLLGE